MKYKIRRLLEIWMLVALFVAAALYAVGVVSGLDVFVAFILTRGTQPLVCLLVMPLADPEQQ